MSNEKKPVTVNAVNPFGNILALNSIKDKKTGKKGGFKTLFDSVESISSAVESLQAFGASGNEESSLVEQFLETLTAMQVKLLDLCKQKIQGSNVLLPPEIEEEPELESPISLPEKLISRRR